MQNNHERHFEHLRRICVAARSNLLPDPDCCRDYRDGGSLRPSHFPRGARDDVKLLVFFTSVNKFS